MLHDNTNNNDKRNPLIYAAGAAGVSAAFFGVALGVLLAFFGVVVAAAFLALGAAGPVAFFFCTAPAVLAGPLVMRPEAVLAETVVSLTTAGAYFCFSSLS